MSFEASAFTGEIMAGIDRAWDLWAARRAHRRVVSILGKMKIGPGGRVERAEICL